jgi:hypothetical protein
MRFLKTLHLLPVLACLAIAAPVQAQGLGGPVLGGGGGGGAGGGGGGGGGPLTSGSVSVTLQLSLTGLSTGSMQ